MDRILVAYTQIESSVLIEHHDNRVTYTAPVNFNGSLRQPRHRWFPYKEGFSPFFVSDFFERVVHRPSLHVLDPFSGVGTTVLEAALRGHAGFGIEVNPLAHLVARTKALSLDAAQLAAFDSVLHLFEQDSLDAVVAPPNNPTVVSYFEEPYLDALLRFKAFTLNLPAGPFQDLFKVAFLSIIETFSTHHKAGNGVKKKIRFAYRSWPGSALDQVKTAALAYLQMYRNDLAHSSLSGSANFVLGSSLELDQFNLPNTFDCVLTSPPYANAFDYSKIYLSELWLGDFFTTRASQQAFRMQSVRSHVHARWPDRYEEMGSPTVNTMIVPELQEVKLWSKHIPEMLSGYFKDMGRLFQMLARILAPGAPAGFVVSNSVYGGIPIATDLLLIETAQPFGFCAERIEVYRYIIPSSQQYVRVANREYFRESLVILRRTA